MFRSYRLGTLLGFPIRVNLTFILLLVAVMFWLGGAVGLLVVTMTAGSVLLHELGHALMARKLGVHVSGIELHFFGGAAQMAGLPRTPRDEIAIAAAGPAVSFALAGVGAFFGLLTGWELFALFATVNLVLGAFNLLPVFPSDGGRILRALLAQRRGLVRATETAVKVGRVLLVAMAVVGLVQGWFQLVLVALVLWMMGGAERLAVRLRGEQDGWRGQGGAGSGGRRPLVADVEYLPPGSRWAGRAAGAPDVAAAPPPVGGRPRVFVVWRRY